MKMVRVLVFLMVALLAACGGGGGGSGDSGSGDTGGGGDSGPAQPVTLAGPDLIPISDTASAMSVTFSATGKLDPASVNSDNVVVWRGAPETSSVFGGDVSLSGDGVSITVAFPRRLGSGRTYPVTVDVLDTLGRPVSFIVSLSVTEANCADMGIWSNPANLSETLGTCVAPIGVQIKMDPVFNKKQDATCALTVDAPLSENCADYLSNGTIRLAETQIVVNSRNVTWASDVEKAVLLDTTDPWNARPAVLAQLASPLPNTIATVTGNSIGGYFVTTVDGKGYQASVNEKNEIVMTCKLNC